MKKILFTIIAVFIVCGLSSTEVKFNKIGDIAEKETIDSVRIEVKFAFDWLKLIDSAQFGISWEETSSFFQKAISKKDWIKTLKKLLPPFGKVLSREFLSKKYYTELPGAPDGEYYVMQFSTSFEKKKKAIETITVSKESGIWRVSGYYIK